MGGQPEPTRRRMTPLRVAFRFFTGRPLDGVRRTDAIFLRPGRHSMDPSGFAYRWSYLAGWQRLAVRLCASYVLGWGLILLAAWGVRELAARMGAGAPEWAAALTPAHVLLVHAGWGLAIGAAPGAVWAVRQWGLVLRVPVRTQDLEAGSWVWTWTTWEVQGRRGWDRQKVRPVAAAAQAVLGTSRHLKYAHQWVQVPRTYRDADGAPVVLQLPQTFTGADEATKRRLVRAVGSRLGMRDPDASWELEGDKPRVLISSPPLPPSHVTFADVKEELEATPEYHFFLGLAARRQVLRTALAGDSPHIAVSAGSGAGKSQLIRVMIMLALRWGWGVVVLDWKEVSQAWCEGLPGVLYVRDIEDIHDMAVRLGEEVDLRKVLRRKDPSMTGKAKVLVVAEEMNMTAALLKTYWDNLRQTAEPEEKATMPLRSPAVDGLMKVNFAGREFDMFQVFVAQRFSARVTNGNGDIRESFNTRLLNRASQQTQKMLAGHIKPYPKGSGAPGRWVAVIGEEATLFQAPLITDEEAREFALGGQDNPSSPLTGTHRPATPSGEKMDHELEESLGDRPALPSQREPEVLARVDARKLADMVDGLDHLDVTLNVLRHAAKDPESGFPAAYGGTSNRGYTYDYVAVQEWARRRHAARAAERDGRK